MTLGCGAVAGNITSDNVGPLHLINIKRLAYAVRQPQEAFEMPLDYNAAPGCARRVARRRPHRPQCRGRRRRAVSGVPRNRGAAPASSAPPRAVRSGRSGRRLPWSRMLWTGIWRRRRAPSCGVAGGRVFRDAECHGPSGGPLPGPARRFRTQD